MNLMEFYIWFTDKIWQYHKNITDLYLRAPSLAASFITLMFVYSIGTQIGSLSKHKHKYLGVISIFFLAVNSAFLAFSFHNRFYAVNMMFISMSTYVLIKLSRNNSNILFVLYTFLMMCTTGTMILSSISIIPHIIFYIYMHLSINAKLLYKVQ